MLTFIQTWDEADQALKELAELGRAKAERTNRLNQEIDDLKHQTASELQPLLTREKELEALLKDYVEASKDQFSQVRHRELNFGVVGFRKSTSVSYKNAKDVIEKLRELQMLHCFKVTETVNKDELAKYNDNVLRRVGAKRVEKDNYYYILKEEEVADNA